MFFKTFNLENIEFVNVRNHMMPLTYFDCYIIIIMSQVCDIVNFSSLAQYRTANPYSSLPKIFIFFRNHIDSTFNERKHDIFLWSKILKIFGTYFRYVETTLNVWHDLNRYPDTFLFNKQTRVPYVSILHFNVKKLILIG